jgi:hypothetical protein
MKLRMPSASPGKDAACASIAGSIPTGTASRTSGKAISQASSRAMNVQELLPTCSSTLW